MHKSGFVNIIGNPNVGKSTLTNVLTGERLSIITSKPQTTRHRILGIVSGDDYQIIFSDSPGMINTPAYGMQKAMNRFAFSSFEDSDILIFVTDLYEQYTGDEKVVHNLKSCTATKYLVINKIDQSKGEEVESITTFWNNHVNFDHVFATSALDKTGTEELLNQIQADLPEGPAYYPKDQLSDKSERFFVSEMIREHILVLFKQEIPYSCEVVVEEFKEGLKEGKPLLRIYANIYVSRKSQKSILIGKGGSAIKKLGIASRASLESFFDCQVFLELNIKVKENWRDDEKQLKHFGYNN